MPHSSDSSPLGRHLPFRHNFPLCFHFFVLSRVVADRDGSDTFGRVDPVNSRTVTRITYV